ncbi:bifunctional 2-polyprenyl-6-hydroxyphenol methylase/3-demethylubiquinol 3-O-methyltransferase UbiG [uncultured Campylobacter sp.]|uniref:class I SAM-dependent methyltransferase n=1 Tax=uncultured Campylobacter sp. TaxID=218934 RepID=UPI0026180793|nr:class I SAM-dependent methyltransferase [uncultured Campylobacter sp.]
MEKIGEKSHKNSWDKKSESYAKFSGELGDFGKRVFEILRGWGVSFAGKSVLDVGAGTGVYSLYLASLGAKVTAIDSSEGMLRELRRSAEEFGISLQNVLNLSFAEFCERLSRDGFANAADENFKIYPRSQSEISNAQAQEARALNLKDAMSKSRESENFKIPAVFDIAFLTMSPALKSTEDFEAFLALGERKIYLNWASERNSSMLAPLFERFGTEHKRLATAAEKFEALLGARDIKFKSEILTEKREQKRSLQEAVKNAAWHLHMDGAKASEREIEEILKKQAKGGMISDEIEASFKLFYI